MDFIEDYRLYTASLEVPEIFHIWSALSALSAAAQRKIWIDLGLIRICPNLYVVLDGLPGCGKSVCMNIVRTNLLAHITGIKTKSDSITKEKIYEAMESAVNQYTFTDGKTKVLLHSSLTIFANEMSLLIKKGDKDFVSALNSLFDSLSVFKHSTKTRGENVIVNPYLNILGGTTPDWIAANIHEDVIEGGLSARTILVYADEVKQTNPFPAISPEGQLAHPRLIARLEQVTNLGGVFVFDDYAREFYTEWYKDHYNKPAANPKMAGYYSRKRVHALKVAMLMSLASKDELVIRLPDIKASLALLAYTEPNMEKALKGVGRNQLSNLMQKMIEVIALREKVPAEELWAQFYGDINEMEFKECLSVLTKMRLIDMESDLTETPTKVTIIYKGEKKSK